MANVKHTTNNGEILTTECKKFSTAVRRFTAFLKEYDRYYNEMLSEIDSENVTVTLDACDTETVVMTLTNDAENNTYTLTIKHETVTPEIIYCICTQDGVIKDFTDRKELFKYAYDNALFGDFEHVWIEEKELRDRTHKCYETVDYESLDLYHVRCMLELDICDMKINDNCVTEAEATAEQTEEQIGEHTEAETEHYKEYILRAFENGKELTIPCSFFNKREYAIDYIQMLYEKRVVSSDVVFTINNQDIYACFSDVELTGTTAQIKYATDILNEFYKHLCNDIVLEQKIRCDVFVESIDYYANLNTCVEILKKVLKGNRASDIIKSGDKFEVWGNIYKTVTWYITWLTTYYAITQKHLIKSLESKLRKELFKDIQILH